MIKKNYKNSGFIQTSFLNSSAGFTLLEIIVVLAIIGMLAVATFLVFGNFNKKQNLSIAYDNVYTAVSEAKSYALSQVIKSCDEVTGELIGYQFFIVDSDEYRIREVCELASNGSTYYSNVKIDTTSLPSGISFTTSNPVTFNVLSGGAGIGSNLDIGIQDADGGIRIIRISPAGAIYDASP